MPSGTVWHMAGHRGDVDRGAPWRLALAAVYGPAVWLAIGLLYGAVGRDPSAGFLIGGAVVFLVLTPVGTWWGWQRRGGRLAVVETRQWIRSGTVPDDVPAAVWRPRVAQRQDDLMMGLVAAALGVVVVALSVGSAVTGSPTAWINAAIWAGLATQQAVTWARWRRPVAALLARPSAPVHSEVPRDVPPQETSN